MWTPIKVDLPPHDQALPPIQTVFPVFDHSILPLVASQTCCEPDTQDAPSIPQTGLDLKILIASNPRRSASAISFPTMSKVTGRE